MASLRFRVPMCRLLAGGGVLLLLGCAGGPAAGPGNRYVVSAKECQFYKNGPAQAFGPDAILPKGEKVTMVKREFGFSQIRLEDQQTGYVATDELTQLPPEKATPKPVALALRRRAAPPPPERGLDLTDTPAPPLPQ